MDAASEFVSFTVGNVTLSGFVTLEELARTRSGEVVGVLVRGVGAVHGDTGEDVPLGDVACTFIGGEPLPHRVGVTLSPAPTPRP